MVSAMDPSEWRERVGRQLEAARKAAGFGSMRAAAKAADISEATWRQLESGERRPSPGVVVAPAPRISTLTAVARAVGLDPVQLGTDAGIYSDDDIRYAEDEVGAHARLGGLHASIGQTMVRNAEGVVGFRTGAPISDRAAALEARLQMVLHDLSIGSRQKVLNYAESVLAGEAHSTQADEDYGLSSYAHPSAVDSIRELGQEADFAVAAAEGSADPHEDEVGPATKRHPGGANPTPE